MGQALRKQLKVVRSRQNNYNYWQQLSTWCCEVAHGTKSYLSIWLLKWSGHGLGCLCGSTRFKHRQTMTECDWVYIMVSPFLKAIHASAGKEHYWLLPYRGGREQHTYASCKTMSCCRSAHREDSCHHSTEGRVEEGVGLEMRRDSTAGRRRKKWSHKLLKVC